MNKMASDFDRSEFMKRLHAKARERRRIYREQGGQPLSYSRFLANDNPVDKSIVAYDVSYQLSYRGEQGGLYIRPETFTVYALQSPETTNDIFQRTKDMVIDMKGQQTGEELPFSTRTALQDNIYIELEPRGLERNESKRSIDLDVYRNLREGGYYVQRLDTTTELTNQRGYTSKVNLDLTHFRK